MWFVCAEEPAGKNCNQFNFLNNTFFAFDTFATDSRRHLRANNLLNIGLGSSQFSIWRLMTIKVDVNIGGGMEHYNTPIQSNHSCVLIALTGVIDREVK